MITEEDKAAVATDPFAREIEDLFNKYGKSVFLTLGMGEDGEGFTMAKGTGSHMIALLLSFAINYEEIFQSFMVVLTTLAVKAGQQESFFQTLVDEKIKEGKKTDDPAIMGSVKF